MKSAKILFVLSVVAFLCALPMLAFAQGDETTDPKAVKFGSVYIKTNTEFPKCTLDGTDVNVEFDGTGKVVTVRQVPRTGVHVIEVIPMDGVFAPGKVKVRKNDFRIRKVSDSEREWRADKRIKLKKAKKNAAARQPEEKDSGQPRGGDEEEED